MSAGHNQRLGQCGEALAAQYLENQGMKILDRNVRYRHGEIDLVALDGQTVVIVEVKTRASLQFGTPAEAITQRKVATLRRLASQWMQDHHHHASLVRIDVISVLVGPNGGSQIERIEGLA